MTITSFYYLVFIAAAAAVYYVLPKSLQWVWLFVLSIAFYCFSATPYTIIYLILSTLLAWGSTSLVDRLRQSGRGGARLSWIVGAAIAGNIILWLVPKSGILLEPVWRLSSQAQPLPEGISIAALGMGYYTLQTIGYILDCYWETSRPQRNPLKLFLFVAFFPQLVTGPISRYDQLRTIYEKHRFQYENITFGAQRILWGFFKKLVLAGRVGIVVDSIWELVTYDTSFGFYFLLATLLYPIQMYADFSGCMDIVIGTAELFDIKLAENFNNPFFSKTSQEFWQRWHITLGAWAKDYVLYPVLKSRAIRGLGNVSRKRFGKKAGKFISTAAGMLALWLVMGIWHGAFKYIVGVSLWYWLILMLGELTAPLLRKVAGALEFRVESASWSLFQMVRTYLIYAVGAVFFRADGIQEAGLFFAATARGLRPYNWNPWIFFDGSVPALGLTYADMNIVIVAVALLIAVGFLREKYGYARTWVAQQAFVFRWMIWIGLFLLVLVYGMYGPGYDAAEFIYQGF